MADCDHLTVVTGGASGIGLATARALLAADPAAHVALVDLSSVAQRLLHVTPYPLLIVPASPGASA